MFKNIQKKIKKENLKKIVEIIIILFNFIFYHFVEMYRNFQQMSYSVAKYFNQFFFIGFNFLRKK